MKAWPLPDGMMPIDLLPYIFAIGGALWLACVGAQIWLTFRDHRKCCRRRHDD